MPVIEINEMHCIANHRSTVRKSGIYLDSKIYQTKLMDGDYETGQVGDEIYVTIYIQQIQSQEQRKPRESGIEPEN